MAAERTACNAYIESKGPLPVGSHAWLCADVNEFTHPDQAEFAERTLTVTPLVRFTPRHCRAHSTTPPVGAANICRHQTLRCLRADTD